MSYPRPTFISIQVVTTKEIDAGRMPMRRRNRHLRRVCVADKHELNDVNSHDDEHESKRERRLGCVEDSSAYFVC